MQNLAQKVTLVHASESCLKLGLNTDFESEAGKHLEMLVSLGPV